MVTEPQDYTLGRGEVHFSRFKTGTQVPSGFRYFGNTPEFNLTIESENLDHFSSDRGIREKDDSVPLEVTRTGSMITDHIHPENIAIFFFGNTAKVTQVGLTNQTETFTGVLADRAYKIGISDQNPAGYFGLSKFAFNAYLAGQSLVAATGTVTFTGTGSAGDTISVAGVDYTLRAVPTLPNEVDIGTTPTETVANLTAAINAGAGAGTAYGTGTEANPDVSASASAGVMTVTARVSGTAGNVITLAETSAAATVSGATLSGGTGTSYIEGVDYEVDYDMAMIRVLGTGAIVPGSNLTVVFGVRASTRDRVISGSTPIEGSIIYIAKNPKGKDKHYMFPWVKLTPNGDYALKGDEWQQIPFTIEALKPAGKEAIYMDGAPAFV